jgi:GT2 family glycosyltransferase
MVKKEFPNVILIENENEGFAKANNHGVKKSKGEYVLFLNPDTVVHEKTIEGMLTFMKEHPKAGAATCTLVMKNGQIDYASHRGFPTPWNAFCYFSGISRCFPKVKFLSGYTRSWQNLNTIHEIDALAGAFMLLPRKAGEEVGWWDQDYFFNGEDLDFCFRLKEKGWKIYYIPQYSILHYNGISGGTKKTTSEISTATKETKRRIQKARFDAMRIFYEKHYRDKYPRFVTGLVLVGIDMKQKTTMKQNGL